MIKLRVWQWVLLALALLLSVLLYLVLRLPLSMIFGEEMQKFGVTDLNGASLGGGDLWIGQEMVSGLVNISYDWCPSNGLGSWCVDVQSNLASFDAVVTPRSSQLHVSDANVRQISPDLLGTMGTLVDGNLAGKIQSIRVTSYECPLQNLEELSAQLHVNSLKLMGSSMGDHQIVARSAGQAIEVIISGESVEGTFNLEDGNYQANGKLLANAQIEAMARSLMRPLGANRYGWEINGKIPC